MTSKHVDLAETHRASWESTQGLSVDVEQSLARNKIAMEQIMDVMIEFKNDMVCDVKDHPRIYETNTISEQHVRSHILYAWPPNCSPRSSRESHCSF